MIDDISVEQRIRKTFLRRGAETVNTKIVVDDMPPGSECIKLAQGERRVILFKDSDFRWTEITTRRLIWQNDDQFEDLDLLQITDVTVDLHQLSKKGATLEDADSIKVHLKSGVTKDVPMDGGFALSGVWNALRALARRA